MFVPYLGDIALVLLIFFCACYMVFVSRLSLVEFFFYQNGWTELNFCVCNYSVYFHYTYLSLCFIEVLQNACFSGLAFLSRWLCSFLVSLVRVLCSLSICLSSAWIAILPYLWCCPTFAFSVIVLMKDEGETVFNRKSNFLIGTESWCHCISCIN